MEIVRQIIDSGDLGKITLPENFKNKKIEITISLLDNIKNTDKKNHTIENLLGVLGDGHKLTPALRKKEKEAWAEAMMDKYGHGND